VGIIFSSCGFFFFYLLSSFFRRLHQPSQIGCVPYFHTWCGLSANLGCISETCCTRLAENTGRKKIAKNSPSAHYRTTMSGYIFATKARIDNRKKTCYIAISDISPTSPYSMVTFGPLAAEIGLLVWGTPANLNGFCILAALLHGTLVVGVSQTAALNRGHHLYSAGWPSRWALAPFFVMAALCNRGAIMFLPCSFFPSIYLSFFPRLISAAAGWMSTILWHMVWP